MLASGAVGLVFFITFPVAPPRLAELGLVDTVTDQSHAYRLLQPPTLTDQYAAMPSLHVGWNLLLALAIATTAKHTWQRAVATAMPVAMTAAVVLTANHYILDAAVGAALTGAAWLLTGRNYRPAGPVGAGAKGTGLAAVSKRHRNPALEEPPGEPPR
jgi:hypothetical protein